ncbi:peptide ABC transporter substrate-binding protein [Candidatus Saccharibacteria bacterium]|nr:peptide ABC transporter substrate-binding protein [Candidatus Saccharibacteria bacterium]NCU40337.1 peptide ABC transporter substrate-binding protein [Candidatus Saccharibacteria bacterium]
MALDEKNHTKNTSWRSFTRLGVKKGVFKRTARKLETASVKHARRFILRRWSNVNSVSRRMISWLVLTALLIGLTFFQMSWFQAGYMTEGPQDGGVYAEGMVGEIETLNPLYISTQPEKTAEKLLFSSLLAYDRDNSLRSDAAKSWDVSDDGKVYTINLRDDIYWHDGSKLTIEDVLFTIKLMQSPGSKTSLYKSWAGVSVEKITNKQIRITTPTVYAPFAHALTFSILPKHILDGVTTSKLREHSFSRIPVGSGPFKFQRIQIISPSTNRMVIHMEKNDKYYGGTVRLSRFQIHTFKSSEYLKKGILTGEVNAAFRLSASDIQTVQSQNPFIKNTHMKLNNGVFAIFNTSSPILADSTVRQALVEATNRRSIISDALYGNGALMDGPILVQSGNFQLSYDTRKAANKLDQLGWIVGSDDIRQKDGQKLELEIVAPDTGDYPAILALITKQWKQVGVKTSVKLVDRDELFGEFVQPRSYDVFLNELSIGADPDVYAYWHSSQAKPEGLNFANYKSSIADDILSSARSRMDSKLRLSKYQAFAERWSIDSPAIALYQPEANYLTVSSAVTGEDGSILAEPSTRLRSVHEWTAQSATVYKTP